MHIRILTCACAVLALTAAGATGLAAEDKKAADALAAARKAIGDAQLASLKTLSVEATLQRNVNELQMKSDVEILLELPDRYLRADVGSGAMTPTFTVGFVGNKPVRGANTPSMAGGGGMVIRMMGPGGPPPGPNEKLTPEQQEKADQAMVRGARTDLSRLMLGWFAMAHPSLGVEYTYGGEAESPDGKAHVIDARNADGFAARLFIDQATNLPVMVTYRAPQPRVVTMTADRRPGEARPPHEAGQRIAEVERQPPPMGDYTLYFDDWREADGLRFPHSIRRAVDGTTTEEWSVGKVRVNAKIDPKKFEG